MFSVKLRMPDSRLLNRDVRTKNTKMGEVRAATGIVLVWSDLTRQCLVGQTVFDIYRMVYGMAPVLR